MSRIRFEIGDRLELTHIRSATGRTLSENKYGSQILDFDGVRNAKISMPIFESRVIPLEVGDDYELCFFTNSGLYQCIGRIRNRYLEKKMYVLDVEFNSELKKYQRRKFYRLECMFPIKYRVISDVEKVLMKRILTKKFGSEEEKQECIRELESLPKEWMEGTVSDLSGGGIRFHAKEEMVSHTMTEIMLPLSFPSGITPVKFLMKVITCVYAEESRIAYEIRGEFLNMKDRDREIVIKYVFEEQRRRMRKE